MFQHPQIRWVIPYNQCHVQVRFVCERHLECRVVGICDDIFIIASLSKALSCAAEMKKILKTDLDMDLNVPKFNVFFPDTSFSLDTARSALERAVRDDPALTDLAAMGAGVSTDGMRVAGVPVGVDAWVKTFVAKKARSVINDVAKLDVVSDGLLHNQLLHFCQNARMAFLGRNTPTPLLSECMAQVDDTIVEAVCRHGTGGGHVEWSPHLRKFATVKIQMPHFRGGFGITPNEGSAISAFYSATRALVVWLGSHRGTRPAQHFSDAWAAGLDLTSPDSWHAPLLQALSISHALLPQDYGCVEWTSESDRVPGGCQVRRLPKKNSKSCCASWPRMNACWCNVTCNAAGPVLKCARCKRCQYCSKKCQKQAWTLGHKLLVFLLRTNSAVSLITN